MDWQAELRRRPWWMTALLVFSAFMTFVYVPWDFFWKPTAGDEEVWFGFVLHDEAAKATEPLHWLIYAAITYGLWRLRPWARALCVIYVAQVAVGMLVWNLVDPRGVGWVGGLLSALPFALLSWAFWRWRPDFAGPEPRFSGGSQPPRSGAAP